jgi:hypothetical protein
MEPAQVQYFELVIGPAFGPPEAGFSISRSLESPLNLEDLLTPAARLTALEQIRAMQGLKRRVFYGQNSGRARGSRGPRQRNIPSLNTWSDQEENCHFGFARSESRTLFEGFRLR